MSAAIATTVARATAVDAIVAATAEAKKEELEQLKLA